MYRKQVISQLVDLIVGIELDHPVRVGIDGLDCAGKTVLANEVAQVLALRDRRVIRGSIDDFHNPRRVRHRRGRFSPIGYYHDSFDLDALISCLLLPLGPGGDRIYKTAHFDYRTDQPVNSPYQTAENDVVLIFDGVFLLRADLFPHWDFTVFVEAGSEVIVSRALMRDEYLFGNPDRIKEIYGKRYIPGQKLYLRQEQPLQKANVVFRNNDTENPQLVIQRIRREDGAC